MNVKGRYFLAIIPPSPIYEQVMEIKTYFSREYNCKAPFRSPAHITLQMPFLYKEEKIGDVNNQLSTFAKSEASFELKLNGFACFEPRVIYVDVEKNEPLQHLQKSLSKHLRLHHGIFNDSYKDRGFHPHMTVAFRDLKKALFPKAWEEFRDKPFQGSFDVKSFWLLEHDSRQWHRKTEFFLGY